MGNKVFSGVVFVLWAASMSWLVTTKILPSYYHGDAPQGAPSASEPVAWRISLSGERCGYAVTQSVNGDGDVIEVHSRVVLDHVSLDKIAPRWMSALVEGVGEIRLDMRNKTTLDGFKNLSSFKSQVSLNDIESAIKVLGRVDEGKLKLKLRTGELERTIEYPWNEGELMGELSPESRLLQAYVGRQWRSEVYSPFGSPTNPVEIVEAKVVEEEDIYFNGSLTLSRRIEYRSVPSAGVSSKNRLKSVVWIADDGRVLRQDVYFLNTRLRFERLSEDESSRLAHQQLDLDTYATLRNPHLGRSVPEETKPQ